LRWSRFESLIKLNIAKHLFFIFIYFKLQSQAVQIANNLFKENKDPTLLNIIKSYASSARYDLLLDALDKFKDYSEQVLEVN
jgi:hypothetical protein